MLLTDIFSNITTLDSANTNLADPTGVLATEHYPKVINAINRALIEIYSQFPVKEKMLTVQLFAHISEYMLTTEYADTNTDSTQPYRYIMDTSFDPYDNEVLKIQTITNEEGTELALNQANDSYSLYTPSYNVVQHPYPTNENAIFVTYHALPKTIPMDVVPATYDVDIPGHVLNLFLIFVAHKVLTSINPKEAAFKLNEYMNLLISTKNLGLFVKENSSNEKFEANGWV